MRIEQLKKGAGGGSPNDNIGAFKNFFAISLINLGDHRSIGFGLPLRYYELCWKVDQKLSSYGPSGNSVLQSTGVLSSADG